ncbi:hypothetical protein TrVFT333_008188 [Trichoderma virens FT-333]|nr:hypothetical protein TrVFT333_008188 [Trichoderma virens FT-333]
MQTNNNADNSTEHQSSPGKESAVEEDGDSSIDGLDSSEILSLSPKKRRYSETTECIGARRKAPIECRGSVSASKSAQSSPTSTSSCSSMTLSLPELLLQHELENDQGNSCPQSPAGERTTTPVTTEDSQPPLNPHLNTTAAVRVQYFTRRWDDNGGYTVSEFEVDEQVPDISTLRKDDTVFAIILEINRNDLSHHKNERLEIWNDRLRIYLQKIFNNKLDADLAVANPSLCPQVLFRYLGVLENQFDSFLEQEAHGEYPGPHWVEKEGLRLLIVYLKTKFASTISDLELLQGRGLITFEHLWVLWKPDILLFSPTTQGVDVPMTSIVDMRQERIVIDAVAYKRGTLLCGKPPPAKAPTFVEDDEMHFRMLVDKILADKAKDTAQDNQDGTGKTFAVEALAEHLQRPLMKLSPASLEIHPQIIDIALHEEKMLDICQRWGAIVLIDDASELLELLDGKRSVAFYIVLRHLKYPKTVIFLTSHNVGIDIGQLTEEEAHELARRNLNGREIQIVVKMALD